MRKSAALFPVALGLGATILVPRGGAQAQDEREGGPIEIEKCQTIDKPGPYVLAHDISNGSGECLVITTDDVTLDLAGHSVVGGTFAIHVPPSLPQVPLRGITVRNGFVDSQSGSALDLASADGSVVEGIKASSFAGDGIAANGIVRGNTVVRGVPGAPSSVGIRGGGVVIDNYVSGIVNGVGMAASGTVRGNTAINSGVGIFVEVGSTAIGNTAKGNARLGIQAACPSNLTDNTALNNGTNLVLIGNGCNNTNNVAP